MVYESRLYTWRIALFYWKAVINSIGGKTETIRDDKLKYVAILCLS